MHLYIYMIDWIAAIVSMFLAPTILVCWVMRMMILGDQWNVKYRLVNLRKVVCNFWGLNWIVSFILLNECKACLIYEL